MYVHCTLSIQLNFIRGYLFSIFIRYKNNVDHTFFSVIYFFSPVNSRDIFTVHVQVSLVQGGGGGYVGQKYENPPAGTLTRLLNLNFIIKTYTTLCWGHAVTCDPGEKVSSRYFIIILSVCVSVCDGGDAFSFVLRKMQYYHYECSYQFLWGTINSIIYENNFVNIDLI